jgi:cytochrome c peroxidase
MKRTILGHRRSPFRRRHQPGRPGSRQPIPPIVPAKVTNPALVELGKKLYFDPRLSKSGFISCNSCHNLSMGGTDNIKTSIGHNWQEGPINAPTVLNSSLNVAQFWDGRARPQGPGRRPDRQPGRNGFHPHAGHRRAAVDPGLRRRIQKPSAPTRSTSTGHQAIAAFEETLVTPNSRFDKWLKGDKKALNKEELAGYSCSRTAAASPATTARRSAATRSRRWASSNRTRRPARPRAASRSPARTPTASTSRCRRCATSNDLSLLPRRRCQHPDKEAVDTMGRLQLGKKFTPIPRTPRSSPS